MAFMPRNFEFVKSIYPTIGQASSTGLMTESISIHPVVAEKIRQMVKPTGVEPGAESIVWKARETTDGQEPYNPRPKPFMSPTFGYVSQWISEFGGGKDLVLILRHADQFLNPKWENGGFTIHAATLPKVIASIHILVKPQEATHG
ncbi:uncharacterized protein PV09_09284 [Verruconis gallopava]|uniref:Linalool dehydratase/isomerase domain-containing protein n=1 Tax=Verruconis gallopava TaxID=253628 RepID=A0A0D1XA49_9PEZI|nr:uncharacterized protein PV09_09284 [Verruconis gallopava]KIV99005.1 hypothetical protein PV09_09284 [Verruconis gallopava]